MRLQYTHLTPNFNKNKYFQTFNKHEAPEIAVAAALAALARKGAGCTDCTGQDIPEQRHLLRSIPKVACVTKVSVKARGEEEAPHEANTELFLIRSFMSTRGRSTYNSGGLVPVTPKSPRPHPK